jgi:hypothetical protein
MHEIDRSRADARGCGGGRADGEEKGRPNFCLDFILFRSREELVCPPRPTEEDLMLADPDAPETVMVEGPIR